MKIVAAALLGLMLATSLSGCVTKAAAAAVEAPGRVVGGLLGG